MENGKESKGTASCGMNSDGSYNCDVVMKKCNYSNYVGMVCVKWNEGSGLIKHKKI